MYKDVAKKFLAGILAVCMVLGGMNLSAFTVQASGVDDIEADPQNTGTSPMAVEEFSDDQFCFEIEKEGKTDEFEELGALVFRTFTGNKITPKVNVYKLVGDGKEQLTMGDEASAETNADVDYYLSYGGDEDNLNVGENAGIITIHGVNSYDGYERTLNFTIIEKNINSQDITVEPIPDQPYTGEAVIPDSAAVIVKHNGNQLDYDTDYTYTCSNNIEEGKFAVVTISGKGNYSGSRTVNFSITRLSADGFQVELKNGSSYDYNGGEIRPQVEVSYANSGGSSSVLTEESEEAEGDYSLKYYDNIQPGTGTVEVTGKGIYAGMVKTVEFAIVKDLQTYKNDITIDIADQIYTGDPVELTADDITVWDKAEGDGSSCERELVFGQDYDISYGGDHTNNGTVYVGITGKGSYKNSLTGTFLIRAATMDDIEVTVAECTYDGTQQKPEVTVSINGNVYTLDTDYTLEYGENINSGTKAGKVTINGKGNLIGNPKTVYFDINAKPLTADDVTVSIPAGQTYYYTGAAVKPQATVTCSSKPLTENTDYTVQYKDCINAGEASVLVTGKGNYTGTVTLPYTIQPKSIAGASLEDITDHTYTYTGMPITPGVKVVMDGATLTRNQDYTVEYDNNTDVGEANIIVTGEGNYTGEITQKFEIQKKKIATVDFKPSSGISITSLGSQQYTGKAIEPAMSVSYSGRRLGDEDITISYVDNTDVGSAIIKIEGKGNFEGTIITSFEIVPRNIATGSYLSVQELKSVYAYAGGSEVTEDSLQVNYVNAGAGMNTTLGVDKDYTVTYANNTEIGTADVTITGINNYTGEKTFHFLIKGSMRDAVISSIPTQVYTGTTIKPEVEVTFEGEPLTEGTHYTLSYGENTEPGTGTVVITGIGASYMESQTASFTIVKKDLSVDAGGMELRGLQAGGYEYTGLPITPEFDLYYNDILLTKDTDYTVAYGNNTETGTGTITITGMGEHFTGEFTENFAINPYDIGQADSAVKLDGVVDSVVWENIESTDGVAFVDVEEEDGSTTKHVEQTGIKVTYTHTNVDGDVQTDELTEGIHYTVSYEKNADIGIASIIITGKEDANFTGTITKEFSIKGDLNSAVIGEIEEWGYLPPLNGESSNKPEPVVTYNGNSLEKGTDYTVSYTNNENIGDTATVIITAAENGNYVGSISATFTIVPRELSLEDSYLTISGQVGGTDYAGEELFDAMLETGYEYNGSAIVPGLAVAYNGVPLVVGTDIEIVSGSGNNTDVSITEEGAEPEEGTQPTVIIRAKEGGNYTGSIELPFRIYPRTITEASAVVTGLSEEGYDYDGGNAIEISELALLYRVSEETSITLVEGTDYTVTYKDNEQIGTATITITGTGNYTGTLERTFQIMGNLEDESYISVAEPGPVPYGGGVAVYPDLVITDTSTGEEKILAAGEDFVILEGECVNNVNVADADSANPPTVVVEGRGDYKGKLSITFTIEPKDLSEEMELPEEERDITVSFTDGINDGEVSNAYVYTGNGIAPQIQVYNNGQLMSAETDYEVAGFVNNVNVPAEDAEEDMRPGVVIRAKENGNYVGEMTAYFNIVPKNINDISNIGISFVNTEKLVYDGTEKEPEIKVTYTDGEGGVQELDAKNYEVSYRNNINASSIAAGNLPTVVVTGIGNYTGEKTAAFTINRKDIADDDITATAEDVSYTGNLITPVVTVKTVIAGTTDDTAADIAMEAVSLMAATLFEGKGTGILEAGTDYHLGECTDVDAGTGSVAVYGDGNYTGERSVTFTIEPQALEDDSIVVEPIAPQTYTGKEVEPVPVVKFYNNNNDVDYVELAEGTDYVLEYSNNVNVGTDTAVVTITAKEDGNYTGSIETTFTITQKNIGDGETMDGEITLQPIGAQIYTGEALTPAVTLLYQSEASGKITFLKEGTDYDVEYSSNTEVGTAKVKVTGKSNYSGTIETTFEIHGDLSQAKMTDIPVQQYTGSEITPLPEVTFAGKTLVKDTDYTVAYANNVERGTATITITGQNWYTGTKIVSFTISDAFSEAFTVTGVAPSYTYTGEDIKPAVYVSDGTLLTQDEDYTVSYENCRNVGTATITITGMGEFSGTKTVTYEIVPRSITAAEFSAVSGQTYTGSKVTPAVMVTYNGTTLTAGTDYTIVYVNNLKPGKASVTIKGRSNFTGTKTINYNIEAPKVSGLKQTGMAESSITLAWSKNDVVTGYEIYDANNKLVTRIKNNSTTFYTITSLVSNTTYTYKVRAYVTRDGVTTRGDFVTIRTTTQPNATKITSASSKSADKVVLEWSAVSGASDYVVYRSTSKDSGYASIGTTASTNYTDTSVKGGTTYYYKVRVRKTLDGSTFYSAYSAAASVKAKK